MTHYIVSDTGVRTAIKQIQYRGFSFFKPELECVAKCIDYILNKMPCHHHSRAHQPHMATVVIKLFLLFTVFMLSAMLPIQFVVQKTAISLPNYIGGNASALVHRVLAFFSFQVRITWKFISTSAPQYLWLAAVPSAFMSISTGEIAAAASDAATDEAMHRKLITNLHWRFIIIGVWWTTTLAHYLDQSIRNVYEIVISCYPSAMFGRRSRTQSTATIAMFVGVILLKMILIKIYWRIVIAFVGRRTNCRRLRMKRM